MNDTAEGDLRLPLTPAEVDAGWLSAALSQRHPGVKVQEATIAEVIWGTSTKIRVRLSYNPQGNAAGLPPTLIVKGGFEEHSPQMSYMYLAEMRYYRELATRMALNVPRCYFTGSDPGSHQSIVIMEDLVPRGVGFCHAQEPHDYARTAAFLDALAETHARWWGRAELQDGGELGWVMQPFDSTSFGYYDYYLQPQRWQHCIRQPRGAAIARVFHDRDWMESALHALGRFQAGGTLTLTHGDTHLGNLYVEADGRPGFLDAQARRAPWYHDVPYHLIGALDIIDRRRWEQPLLSHYLHRLAAHGVTDPPSFDEAFDAYRRSIVYGLFIFMINETRFQTEAINTAYTARFAAAALDHGLVRSNR